MMLLLLSMLVAALVEPTPGPAALLPAAPPAAVTEIVSPQVTAAEPAAAQAAAVVPKGSRIVCRQSEETGTRLGGSRVCMTVDQWRAQDSDLRQELTRGQNGILRR